MFLLYLYFTSYTVAATLLSQVITFSPLIQETIRAVTFIVAASALYIYARYGPAGIYRFYNTVLPTVFTNPTLTVAYDALIHFGPVFLLGLPTTLSVVPLLIAYAVVAIWYVTIRATVGIESVYPTGAPTPVYDTWVSMGIPATLAALYVYNNF
jgi:hypothetical protein